MICVHGRADRHVPLTQSADFVDAATASGTTAELRTVDGDHFDVIDPGHHSWRAVRPDVLAEDR